VKKASKKFKILLLSVIIAGMAIFCIWQNNSIVVTKFDYSSPKITDGFNGFTIAHISDLHNKKFGKNQVKI